MVDAEEPKLFKYKLVLMGDEAVGKTSLVYQFIHEVHTTVYKPTLGCEFYTKVIDLTDAVQANLQIWDLGKASVNSKMLDTYIMGADAILFVYDITKESSFKYIDTCFELVKKIYGSSKLPAFMMIGNKSDLFHLRAIKIEEQMSYCEKNNLHSQFVCARTGDQVKDCFRKIACVLAGIDVKVSSKKIRQMQKKKMKDDDEDKDFGGSDDSAVEEDDKKTSKTKKKSRACQIY